jgi:hypothetical protein
MIFELAHAIAQIIPVISLIYYFPNESNPCNWLFQHAKELFFQSSTLRLALTEAPQAPLRPFQIQLDQFLGYC